MEHGRVVPRVVGLKRRQNVRFSISETRDRAAAVRLECRNGTMLGDTPTTRGRVPVQKARSGGSLRAQTGERPSSRLEWRLSGAHKSLLTKLRVHHGLLVANMVEDHHEGVLHAALRRR